MAYVPRVASITPENNLKREKSLKHKGKNINIFEKAPIGGSPPWTKPSNLEKSRFGGFGVFTLNKKQIN